MCGIFGAVNVDPSRVDGRAALASIGHRGPDASNLLAGPDFVFGHTRLAVLDLTSAAAQPMSSVDGDVVLVFNGEIYNHHEIRAELVATGHAFRSRSDTEVIVEGYRRWGDGVVGRLDGMFALALLEKSKKRVLLARDRAGKKPLFFHHEGGELRFASEVKAIIASGTPAEVDESSLPTLLTLGYPHPGRSMYRGIAQLPPASTMVFEPGKPPVRRRYWKAPFDRPPLSGSVDEIVGRVRTLLEDAVVRRLEADVPLGAFLSGGIDSTVLVGIMAARMGRPVKTFSIGFSGDAAFDETRYARQAAAAFRTEHTEFVVEPSSFDLVERLVALHDGPFGDSSAIPTSIVSKLTREHVTVALTGDGGDELFCGYPRFLAAEAAEWAPRPLRQLAGRGARWMPAGPGERTLLARARRFLSVAALPLADRLVGWTAFFTNLDALLRPDILRRVELDDAHAFHREVFADNRGATTLARVLDHNFETYLPNDLLVKADRASMMHGLELRSPFLDTALVEYAARIPDRMKRRGTNMKWILKHAYRDLLPPEILHRGKMGFGMPLGTWFRKELRGYLTDHLGANARIFEYVERRPVEQLLQAHFAMRADHGHRLWLLLTFEIWLRSLRNPGATRSAA